jgi:hypothetical protein
MLAEGFGLRVSGFGLLNTQLATQHTKLEAGNVSFPLDLKAAMD